MYSHVSKDRVRGASLQRGVVDREAASGSMARPRPFRNNGTALSSLTNSEGAILQVVRELFWCDLSLLEKAVQCPRGDLPVHRHDTTDGPTRQELLHHHMAAALPCLVESHPFESFDDFLPRDSFEFTHAQPRTWS